MCIHMCIYIYAHMGTCAGIEREINTLTHAMCILHKCALAAPRVAAGRAQESRASAAGGQHLIGGGSGFHVTLPQGSVCSNRVVAHNQIYDR